MSLNSGFVNSTIICNEKKEVDLDALNLLASGQSAHLCACNYRNENKHHIFVYNTSNLIALSHLQAGLTFENVVDILNAVSNMMQFMAMHNLVLDNVKNSKEYIFRADNDYKFVYVPVAHKPHISRRDFLLKLLSVIHHKDVRIAQFIKELRKRKDDAQALAYLIGFVGSYGYVPVNNAHNLSESATSLLGYNAPAQPYGDEGATTVLSHNAPVGSEGETTVLGADPSVTPAPVYGGMPPVSSEGETSILGYNPPVAPAQPVEAQPAPVYAEPYAAPVQPMPVQPEPAPEDEEEAFTTLLGLSESAPEMPVAPAEQLPAQPAPVYGGMPPVSSEGETSILGYNPPVSSEGETTVLSHNPMMASAEGETTVLSQSDYGFDGINTIAGTTQLTAQYADASSEYATTVLTSQPVIPANPVNREIHNEYYLYLIRNLNGEQITVDMTPFTIGKDSYNMDYVLNNDSVSRHHATIIYENGEYFIMDNNSTNGTTIEGIRLQPGEKCEIGNGYIISLGNESFQAHIERR